MNWETIHFSHNGLSWVLNEPKAVHSQVLVKTEFKSAWDQTKSFYFVIWELTITSGITQDSSLDLNMQNQETTRHVVYTVVY